jgi:hypothetical protein
MFTRKITELGRGTAIYAQGRSQKNTFRIFSGIYSRMLARGKVAMARKGPENIGATYFIPVPNTYSILQFLYRCRLLAVGALHERAAALVV